MADLTTLTDAVEAGNRAAAITATQSAIDDGAEPGAILDAMSAAMAAVGRRFQQNEIFVPEMLISARAMKEATALLEPLLVAAGVAPEHTAVIGTVKGDLHDIGKNLVAMLWKGANLRVVDLGTNVSAERFAQAARDEGASIVGVSALLTTTMVAMEEVVTAMLRAGLDDVKIVVGGAPVTAEFATSIGAHGYAPDAAAAVDVAKQLLAE
jgi:5-methyltetrahydrofolate--homocysteine methyltransferase